MLRAVHNQIVGMHIFPYDCYVPITYQDFGKGGGVINIFRTGGGGGGGGGGGTGGGVLPPVTARGSGGALIALSVGSGAKPQPLFCFCVYLA